MNVKQTLVAGQPDVKANFDDIYAKTDPCEYYRVLHGLDYIIPDLARPVFRRIVDELTQLRGRPITVLDLGCSYGINAALLRHPIDMDRLAQRYRDLQAAGITGARVTELDTNYFRAWPRSTSARIIGLDISQPAIDYALGVGLLDEGFAEDLERNAPSPALTAALADVDLVISTGCIGYVTERTFATLMARIARPAPWVASFVLRLYPFDRIERCLAERSLATEKLESITFVQRRFHSEREFAETVTALERLGIDPRGKENEGLMQSEFFLSRPLAERSSLPIDQLVSITSGAGRSFGRRFRRHADDKIRLVR